NMKKDITRLPDAELEIMMLLWQADASVPRNYFDQHLKDSKNWADSTILSLLSRLVKKGFITITKDGNRNIYTAKLRKSDYMAMENDGFLSRFYKNSLKAFVASMAEGDNLDKDDIDELRAYLDKLNERGDK
ncbi:MAG: BlaI/MecI/CopY family transcriptional regulator, partial [Oscillospiraceae bacterium]